MKKIIVETYKGKEEYNNQDIQEMIDDIGTYMAADNLPKWLYVTGLNGVPGFPKNKKKVIEVLEKIKNSKNDVYINISSKEPYYKHIIKYKDGGSTSLGVVTIKFDNPKYNYTTNVSSSTTEAEAKRFFVGKMFNVGSYPKENMQKVIGIDFSKSDDKMKKGGGILGDDNHWKNMPKDAAKNLAEYYGNKKLAFNKKELNLSKKDLAELKEVQMMINKYHPEFNHYLSLMHKESKMKTGGEVKGNSLYLELSNIDHTRVVKWMNNQFDSDSYNIKKSGSGYVIDTSKLSKNEVEDLKYYLKQQDYMAKGGGVGDEKKKIISIIDKHNLWNELYIISPDEKLNSMDKVNPNKEHKEKVAEYLLSLDVGQGLKFDSRDLIETLEQQGIYKNGGLTKGFEYSIGGL